MITHHQLTRLFSSHPSPCEVALQCLGTYLELYRFFGGRKRKAVLITVRVCPVCDLVLETARYNPSDPLSLVPIHTYQYSEALKPRRSLG